MLNVRSDYSVILVTTYSRLDLLKRTLDSIAAGTRCSHEIIVIDGGPTDGTIEWSADAGRVFGASEQSLAEVAHAGAVVGGICSLHRD